MADNGRRTYRLRNKGRIWGGQVRRIGSNKVGSHPPFPLDVNFSSCLKLVLLFQKLERCFCHLYPSRISAAFHSRCSVDRISPEVVRKLMGSDHACDHWTGVDSDPQLKGASIASLASANRFEHVRRKPHGRLSVVGPFLRQPRYSQVGVADRLYLLNTVFFGQHVEVRYESAQHFDKLVRWHIRAQLGETYDVSEYYAHLGT